MKYFFCVLVLLLLSSCTYTPSKNDYNYLPNNSLRFIKTSDATSLLINKDSVYYLFLIDKENIQIDVDYLIKYKNIPTSNKAKEEYYLDKTLTIDDLTFKVNDKIEIIINNQTFCIYLKELDKNNYQDCTFIYFYKIEDDFYITLNNNIKVIFYDAYTKFNYHFLYHLASTWLDTYTIASSSYITLTLTRDNFRITQDEIRGKTIHKKEKT